MNKNLSNFKKFYCRKHKFYGSCDKCILLNGTCDYQMVFDHENKPRFNPCPICEYKYSDMCSLCKKG